MTDLEARFVNHRSLAAREPVRAITQVVQQFIYDALGQALDFAVDEVGDRRYRQVSGAASAGARSTSGKTLIMIIDMAFALSQRARADEPSEVVAKQVAATEPAASDLEALNLPDELVKALNRRNIHSLADLLRPLESPLTERQQGILDEAILATMRTSEGDGEED